MPRKTKIAVFVDRDGTICFDKHYLADPGGFELIPTVAEGIKKLNDAGIPVIVVTNQSGIARGYFTDETLSKIHEHMKRTLKATGAEIQDIFYCPHLPGSGCDCRKPAAGLLRQASEKHGIDLRKSFVVGDRMMDVEMAHAVGAAGVLVPEPGDQYNVAKEIGESKEKTDFIAKNFLEAVDYVLTRIEERD
jgi:D-glycero-D-manno-heptose 1,7-bisphosphate phosphatase